jgi:hypothetical protein
MHSWSRLTADGNESIRRHSWQQRHSVPVRSMSASMHCLSHRASSMTHVDGAGERTFFVMMKLDLHISFPSLRPPLWAPLPSHEFPQRKTKGDSPNQKSPTQRQRQSYVLVLHPFYLLPELCWSTTCRTRWRYGQGGKVDMRGSPSRVEVRLGAETTAYSHSARDRTQVSVFTAFTRGYEAQRGGRVANVAAPMISQALQGHCCRAI